MVQNEEHERKLDFDYYQLVLLIENECFEVILNLFLDVVEKVYRITKD